MTRISLLLVYVFALLALVCHSGDGDAKIFCINRENENTDCCNWEGDSCSNKSRDGDGDAKIMCTEKERQALVQIQQGLIDVTGWLISWRNEEENTDCCNWLGVTCSKNSSHVISLYLSHLGGKFNPYHLANLSSLQDLDLSENFFNINGRLEWLNHLPSIEYLHLDGLNLSEANDWLQVVHKLPHLTILGLDNCSLPDPVPPPLSFINSSTSLETFILSNNNLRTSIFQWLLNIKTLKQIDLSYNQLNGTIPESIGNLSKLEYLSVAGNSFEGEISEAHFSKLSKLNILELSSNSFVLNFSSDWKPPFNLDILRLQSCKLGPHFPKWLQTQNKFSDLDISNTGISDSIPNWFWSLTSQTNALNLSYNQLHGRIANLLVEFQNPIILDLSSNQIEGPIPPFLFKVSFLHLSKNRFSGTLSFLCELFDLFLSFLDLSNNLLSGKLPDCWMNLKHLGVLNLANNKFYGEIPNSIGFLHIIEFLHLRNNNFIGELPPSFKNCTELRTIHLGHNRLSGPIPAWIGDSLSNLVVLSLPSNQFKGSVPIHLCHLAHIQLLDLSSNHLSGSIPKCLNKLTALALKGSSNPTISFRNYYPYHDDIFYHDSAVLVWKGREFEYRNTLGLVKSIDFSSNKLAGEIPEEITALVGLVSLNLSRNNLTGEITPKIGQLSSLDCLDLSRNQLVGKIPSSLSQLNGLGVLDLSDNNLSGKIPTGTQLQSFNVSAYDGNDKLCGLPLPNKCSGEEPSPEPAIVHEDEDRFITFGFYVAVVLGFIVGFWGACGSLVLNNSWRYAYFKFLNDVKDKIYVMVVVVSVLRLLGQQDYLVNKSIPIISHNPVRRSLTLYR